MNLSVQKKQIFYYAIFMAIGVILGIFFSRYEGHGAKYWRIEAAKNLFCYGYTTNLDQEKAYNDFSNCIQQPQSDSLFKYVQY